MRETKDGYRAETDFTASTLAAAMAEVSAKYGDLPVTASLQEWASYEESLKEINLLKRPDGTVYGFDLS